MKWIKELMISRLRWDLGFIKAGPLRVLSVHSLRSTLLTFHQMWTWLPDLKLPLTSLKRLFWSQVTLETFVLIQSNKSFVKLILWQSKEASNQWDFIQWALTRITWKQTKIQWSICPSKIKRRWETPSEKNSSTNSLPELPPLGKSSPLTQTSLSLENQLTITLKRISQRLTKIT